MSRAFQHAGTGRLSRVRNPATTIPQLAGGVPFGVSPSRQPPRARTVLSESIPQTSPAHTDNVAPSQSAARFDRLARRSVRQADAVLGERERSCPLRLREVGHCHVPPLLKSRAQIAGITAAERQGRATSSPDKYTGSARRPAYRGRLRPRRSRRPPAHPSDVPCSGPCT